MSRSNGGRIRIIAGALRGSRIDVADRPGLRPTSDRIRETLFNWLAPFTEGASVLDLFAGTGALGIEALSRGAASVDFVEADRDTAAQLRTTLQRLKQPDSVHAAKAERFMQAAHGPYALIFLDPPFASGTWTTIAQSLESGGFLQASALIYVEFPRATVLEVPANWVLHRELLAGDVRAALYRRIMPLG